ncbi:MAG: PAS domain S-box protein, partial [Planctomycetaceae bacterium]|nr:PAS domain S-box protein [Planctomycetaceae bacterium]
MNSPLPRTGDFIDPTAVDLHSVEAREIPDSLARLSGDAPRLRSSHGLVEAILSQLPVTLITIGLDGSIELVEGQALKRLGFSPEEMVGKNFFNLYRNHPEVVEGVKKGLAGESCTVSCTHSGYVFDVRVSPLTNEFQERTGIVALVVDATERHESAKQLTDTNLRLQSIIHSLTDGVIVIKKDGCIEEVNPRAEEILGISRKQLIGANPFGTNWNSIYDDGRPFPPEESPSMTALRTGVPQRDVVMGVRLCNRVLWLSINSEPMIREGETEPFAVVASISDISLRRELAEKERITRDKLTHALRVNTLGEMATVLAHELNQPLTAIALL